METNLWNETYENRQNQLIGMVYTPVQGWHDVYDLDQAFTRGTIFKELDLPFLGEGGKIR